jgi:hypothetical protein
LGSSGAVPKQPLQAKPPPAAAAAAAVAAAAAAAAATTGTKLWHLVCAKVGMLTTMLHDGQMLQTPRNLALHWVFPRQVST